MRRRGKGNDELSGGKWGEGWEGGICGIRGSGDTSECPEPSSHTPHVTPPSPSVPPHPKLSPLKYFLLTRLETRSKEANKKERKLESESQSPK